MDLLCYEEIEYNFIEETNGCNICYESFLKNLNVKDAPLYAALPASIVFILLITTTAPCVVFSGLGFNWFISMSPKLIYFSVNDRTHRFTMV